MSIFLVIFYEILHMLYNRNHQDILNEYWPNIESIFTSLGAIPPSQYSITSNTSWQYCQTENKKDRNKIGYICDLNWTNNKTPFIKITVNNFKLGKETFNSLILDKEKNALNTFSKKSLPKAVIDALSKERKERAAQQKALEATKREILLKEKLQQWKDASHDIQQHLYAEKKQLVNNGLIRQYNQILLYPLTSIETGKICGIQTINANGDKRFFGQQKNAYAVLGNLEKAAFVYLCEGYATANAILQLADHPAPFAVINTLNCHNLIAIALWLKKLHPGKKIILAADNDQATAKNGYANAGLWNASKAAMLTQGLLLYPTNDNGKNVDWCDIFTEKSRPESSIAFNIKQHQSFKELALNRLAYAGKNTSRSEIFSAIRDVLQVFLSDYPLKINDEDIIKTITQALKDFSITSNKIKAIWVSVKKQYFAKALRSKTFSLNPKNKDYTVLTFNSMKELAKAVDELKKEHTKAIFVTNAPMGSGKTQLLMKPNFQQLSKEGAHPIIITPTRALTQGVAEQFKTAHYQKDKETLSKQNGLAITVNSIIQEPFEPFLQKVEALFIDEYTQVLRAITSGTVKACFRQTTHECLSNLIQKSRYVFIADADLNQVALNDLKQSAKETTPIFVMTFKQTKGNATYTLEACSCKQDKITAMQVLQEMIENQETAYIVTDSKKRLSILEEYLKEANSDYLIISSDTLKTEAVQTFLKNPDLFLSENKPQFVIVSPAIQSGISIESDYFDRVLGIYTRTVAPTVFHQMLNRVRQPIPREILLVENFAETFSNENTDTLLSEAYRHYMQQFGDKHTYFDKQTGITHIGLLSLKQTPEGLLIQGDPLFERFERLSASLKALEHQQKNNALAFFAIQLLSDGIEWQTLNRVISETMKTSLKLKEQNIENTVLEERYNVLCGENTLTESGYRQCQAKKTNTIDEIHAMQRFDIAETLSISVVKRDDIAFFDNNGKKVLENYQDLQNELEAAQKKDEIEQKQAISKQDLSRHTSKVKLLMMIFSTLGINLETGEGCYSQSKALKARNQIRQNGELSSYVLLKLSLSVNSRLSDTAFINKIMKKLLGVKANRTMVREGNNRHWYYSVDQAINKLNQYTNNINCHQYDKFCHQKSYYI